MIYMKTKEKSKASTTEYICKLCNYSTPDRKEIRSHVRLAHGIRGGGKEPNKRNPLSYSYVGRCIYENKHDGDSSDNN